MKSFPFSLTNNKNVDTLNSQKKQSILIRQNFLYSYKLGMLKLIPTELLIVDFQYNKIDKNLLKDTCTEKLVYDECKENGYFYVIAVGMYQSDKKWVYILRNLPIDINFRATKYTEVYRFELHRFHRTCGTRTIKCTMHRRYFVKELSQKTRNLHKEKNPKLEYKNIKKYVDFVYNMWVTDTDCVVIDDKILAILDDN